MRYSLPLAALLALSGCYNMPGGDVTADSSGANSVNGSIHVPAGTHSKSVGTVNGWYLVYELAGKTPPTAGAA